MALLKFVSKTNHMCYGGTYNPSSPKVSTLLTHLKDKLPSSDNNRCRSCNAWYPVSAKICIGYGVFEIHSALLCRRRQLFI
jgi:hypothetical protein